MSQRVVVAGALGAGLAMLALAVFVAGAARVMQVEQPTEEPATGSSTVLAQEEGWQPWGLQPDGSPVRWNPCEPIRWVLDANHAPEQGRQALSLAMARITAVSGLEFEFVGMTDELPDAERSLVTEGPDGPRWAPVLVAWVPADSIDLPLSDMERGVAVPVAVREGGDRVFVTGQVVLNADKTLLPMFEDRHASWGAVLLHELGHLVGLDHVSDPEQLMAPTPGFGPVRWTGPAWRQWAPPPAASRSPNPASSPWSTTRSAADVRRHPVRPAPHAPLAAPRARPPASARHRDAVG